MANEFIIEEATRSQAKLRIGLAAPSGGGKTMGALKLAFGMVGDWSKIGVVDTEKGSASLYAHLGKFKTIKLEAPYTPERYIGALKALESAGCEVIVLDSVTHVWAGKGGLLESNNQLGGRFQDWAKTTPRYQAFIEGILESKAHVITTIRKKESYAMTNEGGKSSVQKQGLDDQIRDGFTYELTVSFDINIHHIAEASKDRTSLFMKPDGSNTGITITEDTGKMLIEWAQEGTVAPVEPLKETETVKTIEKDPEVEKTAAEKFDAKKVIDPAEFDMHLQSIDELDSVGAAKAYYEFLDGFDDSEEKEKLIGAVKSKGKTLKEAVIEKQKKELK